MRKTARDATIKSRPAPPSNLVGVTGILGVTRFVPAPELSEWVASTFLSSDSPLFNEEHIHLLDASIGFLWSAIPAARQGKAIVGLAEIPTFQGNQWQRERQEQQVVEWFGHVPDFIVTLYADYAAECEDVAFCSLIEHELYHCGQERDAFGAPKFRRTGQPKFAIRGHDVEEFVGIVARYGPGAAAGDTMKLVKAAAKQPEISWSSVSHACGTCLLKAA